MQAVQSSYVVAVLAAGALCHLVPGGIVALVEVNRLPVHRQVQLDDHALLDRELATLRRTQATTYDAEAEISGMVAMR